MFLFFFFFFQAEDGIRDRTVTGVQTCALPIWRAVRRAPPHRSPAPLLQPQRRWCGTNGRGDADRDRGRRISHGAPRYPRRSEERRVGKECRARGGGEECREKRWRTV